MLWLILALIASEVAMLLIGPRVLPVLRKLKFGQSWVPRVTAPSRARPRWAG